MQEVVRTWMLDLKDREIEGYSEVLDLCDWGKCGAINCH